jgi:hypothetical protein
LTGQQREGVQSMSSSETSDSDAHGSKV